VHVAKPISRLLPAEEGSLDGPPNRAASEADLLKESSRHKQWMIRTGTTAAEAKSGYGLSLESELKILRVIRSLSKDVHFA